jgi:hypothetical protein
MVEVRLRLVMRSIRCLGIMSMLFPEYRRFGTCLLISDGTGFLLRSTNKCAPNEER